MHAVDFEDAKGMVASNLNSSDMGHDPFEPAVVKTPVWQSYCPAQATPFWHILAYVVVIFRTTHPIFGGGKQFYPQYPTT